MMSAVLSFLPRPLNAASSVLLKMHSRFLISGVHPLILLHALHWYRQFFLLVLDFSIYLRLIQSFFRPFL